MTIAFSKGQLGLEALWVVVVLIILGLGLVFGLQVFDDINNDLQDDDELSADAKSTLEATAGNAPSIMDNVFFFLMVGLWAFLLVGAYFSGSNPIITVIAIILGVLGLIVTLLVANVYAEAVEDDDIQDFVNNFPKMNWILENILIIMVFITFSTMLVMYATNS